MLDYHIYRFNKYVKKHYITKSLKKKIFRNKTFAGLIDIADYKLSRTVRYAGLVFILTMDNYYIKQI